MTKQQILDEIKRTAKENGGKPLGTARFESETGIKPYDWGKFWVKFGDAQKEAGLTSNQFQSAYADEILIEKLINLARKIGKLPGQREMIVERNIDATFPSDGAFYRFSKTKKQLAEKVFEYCKSRNGYNDVIEICTPILEKSDGQKGTEDTNTSESLGEVYLFKSGKYYKIGKTYDAVRRGSELRIQLPEKMDLIHSIKTDDPSGIEAYWHRRFEAKRMNGEWFDLNTSEIKAFKRWKRIV